MMYLYILVLVTVTLVNTAATNEIEDLVKPCMDDLAASLIHEDDVDGAVLYQVGPWARIKSLLSVLAPI
jgi:predicted transcriptional regulator